MAESELRRNRRQRNLVIPGPNMLDSDNGQSGSDEEYELIDLTDSEDEYVPPPHNSVFLNRQVVTPAI